MSGEQKYKLQPRLGSAAYFMGSTHFCCTKKLQKLATSEAVLAIHKERYWPTYQLVNGKSVWENVVNVYLILSYLI